MRLAGFTFIRNAVQFDYPIVEAITSILPICDYFVVAVGQSDDATLSLIRNIGSEKIKIFETIWDDSLRAGGQVLAVETNKAFDAIPSDFDWCFYIQGDECVHEDDLPKIRSALQTYLQDPATEGFLFHYRHFYGSYQYIGTSSRWYRREVRIVRNDKTIRSYRDAQGFRRLGKKLQVRQIEAYIHHYGWVRHPQAQQHKQLNFNKFWHSDDQVAKMVPDTPTYVYDGTEPIQRFMDTHPKVMQPRIAATNWEFSQDPSGANFSWKEQLRKWVEVRTGYRIGEYKNFKLLKN